MGAAHSDGALQNLHLILDLHRANRKMRMSRTKNTRTKEKVLTKKDIHSDPLPMNNTKHNSKKTNLVVDKPAGLVLGLTALAGKHKRARNLDISVCTEFQAHRRTRLCGGNIGAASVSAVDKDSAVR